MLDRGDISLSKYQIFCLDSDYTFISGLADDFAGTKNTDPFVFWTLVHSKENIHLNPNLVDNIISHMTGIPVRSLAQRSESVFQSISEHIFEPFTKILYLNAVYWVQRSSELATYKSSLLSALNHLKKKSLGATIDTHKCKYWNEFSIALKALDDNLIKFLDAGNLSHNYANYRVRLEEAGISTQNIYFFIRGHDWSAIVKELACKRLEHYKIEHIKELKAAAPASNSEKIQEYINSFGCFITTLHARPPQYDGIPFFPDTMNKLRTTYA